jgi:hypothetical protein
MRVLFSALLLVTIVTGARQASADEPLDPAWGVSEPDPLAEAYEPRPRYSMFGAVDLGVPIVLDTEDIVRPGVNLHAQGGMEFNYIAGFVHGGFRWIPIDFDKASSQANYDGSGRSPLKNGYFGLGVRFQVPNRSRVLPYLSGSFDFNFWNFHEEEVVCTGYYYWWCTESDKYRFTPGFSGRAGVAVRASGSFFVDLGLGASMSFQGDFFDKNQVWLEPFIGVTQRL